MANANAEMDMKANLTDLTKIPDKEFEKHFRDWMERDDVARALQAKLRTDLILNFNKTALGRQILAQTSTTTAGGSTQRLTLSPLVLALNTLVAEFLYAQNCHFSLSVFCTEVPFRNTLPDFESAQHFRFTAEEIKEILEAIFGKSSYEPAFKGSMIKKYECNKNVSLLLLLLRHLIKQKEACIKKMASIKSGVVTEGTQTTQINAEPNPRSEGSTRRSKTEIPSGNIRYLNKYLLILSNKVKEMSEEFEDLRSKRSSMPSTKISKSVRTRRYEKLNRSLERIMDQLKHMTRTKRKSKQVGAVVSAIDSLATQFTKCLENFKSVSRELIASHQQPAKPIKAQAAVQVDLSYRRAAAGEQKKAVEEKTYMDWVHEMRHTKNGQKFLDRIESSLQKALNKQRELLRKESEEKLNHQKELLRIQYKEKLMEHITRLPVNDFSNEAQKLNESIGHQLEEFELRHSELLQQIQQVHKLGSKEVDVPKATAEAEVVSDANMQTEMAEALVRRVVKEMDPRQSPTEASSGRTKEIPFCVTKTRDPVMKDVVNTQKQLQKMVQSITKQERNVDQIVYEARMRIQELENESNQLEMNFRNYLERQRIQADTMREVVSSLSENHKKPPPALAMNHHEILKNIQKPTALKAGKEKHANKLRKPTKVTIKPKPTDLMDQENKNPNFEYRNAILDAKTKFFKVQRRNGTKMGSDDDGEGAICLSQVEPYFYNRNFGRFESHINLHSSDASSYQLNEEVAAITGHPSPLAPIPLSSLPVTGIEHNTAYTNALSARSNGAPLEKRCTVLPNTPQIIQQKSILKREKSMTRNKHNLVATKTTNELRKDITQSLPAQAPFSDATTSIVIGQKTTMLATVEAATADNGASSSSSGVQLRHALLKDVDSDTSFSSSDDDDDIQDKQITEENQSMSDCSKSSSSNSSIGSGCHVDGTEADREQSIHIQNKKGSLNSGWSESAEGAGFQDVYAAKTTIKINPQCNTTLMETMERMHRLFTGAPKSEGARGKWTQANLKIEKKPIPREKPKCPQSSKEKAPTIKTNRQQKNAAQNTEVINEENPSTSTKCLVNVKTGKNVKQTKEEEPADSPKSHKQTEHSLNNFPNEETSAHAKTDQSATAATQPQYNITAAANSATALEKLPTTISSTTFSVALEDNLKEIVSESSIEIAGMVEAVDEEIELDELVAEADEEEENEEEYEEEHEPMGAGAKLQDIVKTLVNEEVSVSNSSTSSVLRMSASGGGAGGGAADRARHSDSGSDFWE